MSEQGERGLSTPETDAIDRSIVEFIQQYQAREGYSPSLEEIGGHVGMTKQGADWRVRALLEAGVLHRKPGQPRTLTVVHPLSEGVFV